MSQDFYDTKVRIVLCVLSLLKILIIVRSPFLTSFADPHFPMSFQHIKEVRSSGFVQDWCACMSICPVIASESVT